MPPFLSETTRGDNADSENQFLRAYLINIFLIIFTVFTVIIILFTFINYPSSPAATTQEIRDLYIGSFCMLVGLAIIYVIKRWISVDAASILLLFLLLIVLSISDTPYEVAEGRSIIYFSIPILVASVLTRDWGSFIIAGLSSAIISFLDIVYLHKYPNFLAIFAYFILALTAWLFARARNNAIRSLIEQHEKSRLADEKIKNMAKFPTENPSPVLRINSDGILTYANQASDVILSDWRCQVGDDIPEEWKNKIEDCLQENQQQSVYINLGGIVYSLFLTPIGESNYVNIYGRDETERVQGEIALREREEKYRLLFESMLDGFALHEMIYDATGNPIDYRYLEVNPAFEKLLGLSAENIIGKTVLQVIPDLESKWIQIYGDIVFGKESRRFEEYSSALGKYFEIVAFSSGKNQFATIFVDISERKKAEDALKKSMERERKITKVLDHSSQPFAVEYPNGLLESFNQALSDMLGYTQEEFRNISWIEDITPPEWRDLEMRNLHRLVATDQSVRFEKELLCKNGERIPVELLVHLERDEYGKPQSYLAFITDLTERKKAEREVRQLNVELEHRVEKRTEQLNNTLSELESFAYSVSHDLRAPLRAIDGFSQALESEYGDKLAGDGLHYLGRVRAGVKRMDQLINDLLKLSRVSRQNLNYGKVDLTKIGRQVCNELRISYPEREVQWHVDDGMRTQGDANLLKLAIDNLLSNAWKFTSKEKVPEIEFGVLNRNSEITYFVRDNGVGFDMDYSEKLFGTFQRLHSDKEFPGTGIGLATVQRIIHRHGGNIWAEASINQGATFYFTLGDRDLG